VKEAIAWHYHGLFVMGLVGVGWLALLIVTVLKTSKLEIVSRAAILSIVALSLPAYIGYRYWYSQNSPDSLMGNAKLNIALATEQTELYRKQCGVLPAIDDDATHPSENAVCMLSPGMRKVRGSRVLQLLSPSLSPRGLASPERTPGSSGEAVAVRHLKESIEETPNREPPSTRNDLDPAEVRGVAGDRAHRG